MFGLVSCTCVWVVCVWLCVSVYGVVYVSVCVIVCVWLYVWSWVGSCVYVYVCVYVCGYVRLCMCLCIHVYVWLYVCVYVYVYVCLCGCVWSCMSVLCVSVCGVTCMCVCVGKEERVGGTRFVEGFRFPDRGEETGDPRTGPGGWDPGKKSGRGPECHVVREGTEGDQGVGAVGTDEDTGLCCSGSGMYCSRTSWVEGVVSWGRRGRS